VTTLWLVTLLTDGHRLSIMLNSKEWLICAKSLELFFKAKALKKNGK